VITQYWAYLLSYYDQQNKVQRKAISRKRENIIQNIIQPLYQFRKYMSKQSLKHDRDISKF